MLSTHPASVGAPFLIGLMPRATDAGSSGAERFCFSAVIPAALQIAAPCSAALIMQGHFCWGCTAAFLTSCTARILAAEQTAANSASAVVSLQGCADWRHCHRGGVPAPQQDCQVQRPQSHEGCWHQEAIPEVLKPACGAQLGKIKGKIKVF